MLEFKKVNGGNYMASKNYSHYEYLIIEIFPRWWGASFRVRCSKVGVDLGSCISFSQKRIQRKALELAKDDVMFSGNENRIQMLNDIENSILS